MRKAVIVPAVLALALLFGPGCEKKAEPVPAAPTHVPAQATPFPTGEETEDGMKAGQPAPGQELMGSAESREAAEAVAELYGIQLVGWGEGIAVYTTDRDPAQVIRQGQENGWPALEINRVVTLKEPASAVKKLG